MNKKLTAIIFVLLVIFTFNHSMDLTSQINVNQVTEPEIESIPTNNVNVAHITEPTSAPVVHEYKDDLPSIAKETIEHKPAPSLYTFYPYIHLHVTESNGFLTARKYQSSYLV